MGFENDVMKVPEPHVGLDALNFIAVSLLSRAFHPVGGSHFPDWLTINQILRFIAIGGRNFVAFFFFIQYTVIILLNILQMWRDSVYGGSNVKIIKGILLIVRYNQVM